MRVVQRLPQTVSSIEKLIREPSVVLAEVVTGALSAGLEPSRGILVVGRLIQAVIKNEFITQFGRELTELRNEGKIPQDYIATNQDKANLIELMQAIDEGVTEETFRAMRMIFIRSIYIDSSDKEKMLAYQLMMIAKQFSSAEVMLLSTSYRIKLTTLAQYGAMHSANEWLELMAIETGLQLKELVAIAEDKLIQKMLYTDRRLGDKSGIHQGDVSRLTPLGLQICERMVES